VTGVAEVVDCKRLKAGTTLGRATLTNWRAVNGDDTGIRRYIVVDVELSRTGREGQLNSPRENFQ